MSRLMMIFASALILIAGSVAAGTPAAESITVVGTKSAACPNAEFATIQAGVTAASPGDTVRVCAGTYREQVTISKALTVMGENAVVIEPSGVTPNATGTASGQSMAAIILVENTTDVNIRNVIVDGANNGITECAPDLIGILYQNASGEVDHTAVRNLKLSASLNSCQSGSAIMVQSGGGQNSVVNISDSSIHDYQKNGITANETGTQVQIDHNVVTGIGPTAGAAQNGIQIGFGATGSVAGNSVANHVWAPCTSLKACDATADDILIYQSDGVTVTRNVAGVSQTGVAIVANGAQVDDNRVFGTMIADGIEFVGNGNSATSNQITDSSRAGVFVAGDNNVVEENAIDEAAFGVLENTGSAGNILTNNNLFNATVGVQDPAEPKSKASPYR
jgi:hypothetical protein